MRVINMHSCGVFATIEILILFSVANAAFATAPSVKYADIARRADCVLLADFISDESKTADPLPQSRSASFVSLATIAGTECPKKDFVVNELTSEDTKLAPGTFMLFLVLQNGRLKYAYQAFSALRVKNGAVDTLYFPELKERPYLEDAIRRIVHDRAAQNSSK